MNIEDAFYRSYCEALERLELTAPQQVVVALGGGADSQTVLDLTLRFRESHPEFDYLAIHLDHFFHPDSPQWAQFLRDDCARLNMPAIVEPLQVPTGARQSKEAVGRAARYQRLAELTEPTAVILLGQHLSDQSETFLLQLKRGSGPKGLSAMAEQAPFSGKRRLCRPLLSHAKDAIYTYARSRDLRWIEDDTNSDTQIDRNFLRHEIIPRLRQRWPQFEEVVARSARLCAEQQHLLDDLLQQDLTSRVSATGALQLTDFERLSDSHQRALLRAWLQQSGASMPSEAVLKQLVQQLHAQHDAQMQVRWGEHQIRRYQQSLMVLPLLQSVADFGVIWNGHDDCVLPDELGVIRNQEGQGEAIEVAQSALLQIRMVHPGDKFRPQGRSGSRALTRLLKDRQVPPWQRLRWPVICIDDTVVWAAGLGANADYVPTEPTYCLWPSWEKGRKAGAII
ncbi:tRNA lysidine(34) synthetase TilS [Aliidiomarina sp. Khilg15.8]